MRDGSACKETDAPLRPIHTKHSVSMPRHDVPLPCRAVNSHMPCRAPALLRQCRVLREIPRGGRKYPNCQSSSVTDCLFCSVVLPFFTAVGMDRCEEDSYASGNNLRGTPRGSRKKPKAVRQPTGRLLTAVLCRGLENNSMVRAWHGKCESDTAALCKSNRKDTFQALSSTAWARLAMCELARMVTNHTEC